MVHEQIYKSRQPEEIARILDIIDRNGITADDLERMFPELPPRHGAFTAEMSFREMYAEMNEGLQNLQDRLIELGALYLRETKKNNTEVTQ